MNKINPELQAQVETLANHCGNTLQGSDTDFIDSTGPVIKMLVMGAYDRLSDVSLSNRVEETAVDRFGDTAIHRRAQLRSLCQQLQDAYEEQKRWNTTDTKPGDGKTPPCPANISSNTDS